MLLPFEPQGSVSGSKRFQYEMSDAERKAEVMRRQPRNQYYRWIRFFPRSFYCYPLDRNLGVNDGESEREEPKRDTIEWKWVIIFYALACAFSWPFFWWRDMAPESWNAWRLPGFLKTSTYMWGPGLAALIVMSLRGRGFPRTITFFGPARKWSLAFYIVPLCAVAAVYVPLMGPSVIAPTLLVGVVGLFNILGEELGWRGFLQDALRPLPRIGRYLLIGILWEAWHFTNRIHGRAAHEVALTLAVWYPSVIILSAVIGEAADRSRALLVAVTLHLWVDALFELPSLFNGPAFLIYAVFGASSVFWLVLLWKWPSRREPTVRSDFTDQPVPQP
jgi:membrane protease YdiL (CAAX protease family)